MNPEEEHDPSAGAGGQRRRDAGADGSGAISNSSVVTANGTFDISAASASFNPITALAGSGTVALGDNTPVITSLLV